ncbi:GDSL-like Lipase/Acylhydrolase superfamily protein, putative [Theobroma cacao]|uniref:GDSL-like Lipase/Acylhydrolase superfamily protein, putative n=1 Tax=Theobroma cacao TaxID=3641 RepID=A0A061GEF0_THECC|nr:GDSL-like Lipase/Acylhydrolase superfamily protein, putative [Theobroma cacao]
MGTISNRLIIICSMCQILAVLSSPGICSAANVSAVFVFGDSLVEAGNNYYINTIAKPGYPNGIDFAKGSPSGRYTNARTVADIIEEELGFENYSPPYLAPNTTGDVILKGVNYASSGAGILTITGSIFGERVCMDKQVSYFAKTRQDIILRLGATAGRILLREALYLLAIGANDILFQQISTTQDITQYLDDVLSKFKSQLITLYNLDARKIIVTGSPPVGCIPFERDVRSSPDSCVSSMNDLAKLYNSRLKSLLQKLTTNLPGSTFVYVDNFAILEDIMDNYRSYGFESVDSACCRVIGRRGGLVPCGSLSRVCPDRTKFVFWDPFHPTESANLIGAKHALDGGLQYVSPMNIRQLANA